MQQLTEQEKTLYNTLYTRINEQAQRHPSDRLVTLRFVGPEWDNRPVLEALRSTFKSGPNAWRVFVYKIKQQGTFRKKTVCVITLFRDTPVS